MDETRALEALAAILARPELNPAPPPFDPWRTLWAAIRELLWDFLQWLFSPVGRVVRGQADLIQLAAVAGALVVIGLGAWFVLRAVRQNMVADAASLSRAQAQRRERADRLWREAHDLAVAGRLSDAVRALYLSALYALEERDVLPVQDALTNREHADRLARLPGSLGSSARSDASAAFAEVVQRYDRLRYGGYPVDRQAYDELRGLVQRARSMEAFGPGQPNQALTAA